MPLSLEDMMRRGLISDRTYAKRFGDPGDQQDVPPSQQMVQQPTFARAPQIAEDVAQGVAQPLLGAGNYLGGLMQGSQQFNWPDVIQHGAALAMAMAPGPKGERVAGAVERGLAGAAESAGSAGIRAYHGSPHDFDKFDLSKIGTGEGAQAYGHGLYFAEREGTAKAYRDKLAPGNPDAIRPAEEFIDKSAWDAVVEELRPLREKQDALRRSGDIRRVANSPEFRDNGMKIMGLEGKLDAMNDLAVQQTIEKYPHLLKGRMYEVNIKANPEHFLDWDKPISQQPQAVQDALKKVPWAEEHLKSGNLTGGQIVPQTPEGVAQLREAGIPGIKYKDQGSRIDPVEINSQIKSWEQALDRFKAGGETEKADRAQAQLDALTKKLSDRGTSNYVAFDDKMIDIIRKYGLAGLLGGGGVIGAASDEKK